MAKKTQRRAKATARVTGAKAESAAIPDRIFAHVSPKSIGGVSLFDAQGQIHPETVGYFRSDMEVINRTVNRLQDAGFEVLQVSEVTINIAGSAAAYERAFKTKIVAQERPVIKSLGVETTATFFDSPDTVMSGLISTSGTLMADLIEGVAIEEPRYLMAPSMFAPLKSYWHLRMPGDVSLAANADRAHRSGITGQGIKVAMVDTGWYKHPYFVGRGYRVSPVVLAPGAANPLNDEVGHGTAESANIFAIAPDAELLPVKWTFTNSVAAFNTAVGLGPHIITCSWGSSKPAGPLSAADLALASAISAAVAAGIIVVFSAGNGHWGFPAQVPDVIAAGGVYMKPDETLQASDYASGFISTIYPGRRVPDVCGLVGMRPKAIYIMLPLQPGDDIDSTPWNAPSGVQGGTHPQGDETANNDGWAGISGTSAAAPQIAGAAALIKQACSSLNPAQVKDVLTSTARDVTAGTCSPSTGGSAAGPGPDTATGYGLVDAHKAVLVAKLRCLGPITPRTVPGVTRGTITPGTVTPGTVTTVVTPRATITPRATVTPGPVTRGPIETISPPGPREPGPVEPAPVSEGEAGPRLSSEDVAALEEIVKSEDIDLGR